jgi:hypothetical protein
MLRAVTTSAGGAPFHRASREIDFLRRRRIRGEHAVAPFDVDQAVRCGHGAAHPRERTGARGDARDGVARLGWGDAERVVAVDEEFAPAADTAFGILAAPLMPLRARQVSSEAESGWP